MNSKSLNTLEYHKIIQLLEQCASSELGKELCRSLVPQGDLEVIRTLQTETTDALSRIWKHGTLSFSGVKDVRGSLKRLEIGSTLNIEELLRICVLLENTNRVKSFSRQQENRELPEDSLDAIFQALQPLTPLSGEIRRCILSQDEISDDASPTLRHIRRTMKQVNSKIHDQLVSMVNGSVRTYLQDAVITMRNNRYCIPVKAEYKGQVPGMIHDQSSTGSTLFVEPMAIVKLNNDLKELSLKEEEEIEVILATLSQQAALEIEAIGTNQELLTQLDFIFARASLSRQYDGTEPVFNTKGYINIKKGRHPLLDKHKVVPIDITLGKEFNLLIVTGPNTGGKTVSLKTVGLFTLMGQSGLHIPAFQQSELAIFQEVYADIGDEQSIEQSLSTFSSHMTNIVTILEKADENSLCLFDELCTGTDPTEGAALAIAILSNLHSGRIRTMATTHYSELKVYALSTPGVENACCEFDLATLRPTYRLLIGIPGKSNAFAISSKLGLPDYIIEDAKSKIDVKDENFEDLLSSLEMSRKTIESEQDQIQQYKEEVQTLKKRLEQKQERLEEQRERLLREANEQALTILRDAKAVADETIKNFNKFGKEGMSAKEMEQERNKLRSQLAGVEKGLSLQSKPTGKKKINPNTLRIGDAVKVLSLNLKGTVSTLPNAKGKLYVQMGIMRSQVSIDDLELIEEMVINTPSLQRTNSGSIKMSKSFSVSPEINLIGRTTDEAIQELDKYLDDAYLAHLPQVRIVHGKGTGALRKAVHAHLKRQKYIKSFRLGAFGEGEAGVTIAEFK